MSRLSQEGTGIGPHTECSKDKWGFLAKRQSGGVSEWKSAKRRQQGWGDSGQSDLTGFLQQAGQGDQIFRVEGFFLNGLSRTLAKTGLSKLGTGRESRGGFVGKRAPRSLTRV